MNYGEIIIIIIVMWNTTRKYDVITVKLSMIVHNRVI